MSTTRTPKVVDPMMLGACAETGRKAGVRGLLLGGLLVAALGCRDGTTESGDDPLAMAEAVALFEGMRAIEQDSMPRILHASEDSVVAWPISGRLKVMGSVAESASGDTLRLETDFTTAPAACRFSRDGHEFTVDGDPGIREHTVVVIAGFLEHISIDGAVTGIVDWQLDARSGSCYVDLVQTGELARPGGPSVAGMLSGRLCDHAVDLEI